MMTRNKILVCLKDGSHFEAVLASPFGSRNRSVDLVDAETGHRSSFMLDEICYIRFANMPVWVNDESDRTREEIGTTAGEAFQAEVLNGRKFDKGFIAVLEDESAQFRTTFFSSSGVRYRNQERLVGQIIHEQANIPEEQIVETLQAQAELRGKLTGEIVAETEKIPADVIETVLHEFGGNRKVPKNIRVGDILVEAGLITGEQLQKALETQKADRKVRIGELLITLGYVTEEQLLLALATKFDMEFVELEGVTPCDEALSALSEGMVTRLQVFPLDINGRMFRVATSNPTDHTIYDSLRFSTNHFIELVVATREQIAAAINRFYHGNSISVDAILEEMIEEGQALPVEDEFDEEKFVEPDSKVVSLINKILIDAYKKGASDIHFEPGIGTQPLNVRYRIDGECVVLHTVASNFKHSIISRIKIISGLDISEHRRPQSGKIMLRYEKRKLEYRVEITPTVGGNEDAVLRLLAASRPLRLEEMGLMPYNLERFREILAKPFGLILCVGPTGSGKTTTLHSAIGHINKPNRKIWTAEDPVEITQPGLRQVQVNYKIGFNFSEALRSFLRADPDVIMIGEMRDAETAKIAIESSLTGHMVFSTLHTNSAPETVVRLIDMGMDSYNFADAMLMVLAQRLARKLCDECKQPLEDGRRFYDELLETFVREAGQLSDYLPSYEDSCLMAPVGCPKCNGIGYKGRIALHELMAGTPAIKRAIKGNADAEALKELAQQEGMWTLKMDGIMKVLKGYTDMEQILKVCV